MLRLPNNKNTQIHRCQQIQHWQFTPSVKPMIPHALHQIQRWNLSCYISSLILNAIIQFLLYYLICQHHSEMPDYMLPHS